MIQAGKSVVAGLEIAEVKCPKCGRPMFIKPCPCFLRRKGWETCVKCVKCGHQAGYKKRRKR